jgi:hypothetical protein
MLSGDVAVVRFEVRVASVAEPDARQALSDQALTSAFQERVGKKLKDGLGSEYIAAPISGDGNLAVETMLSTGYSEASGPDELVEKVGQFAQASAGELSKLLRERLGGQPAIRPDWVVPEEVFQGSQPLRPQASEAELYAHLGRLLARRRQYLRVRQRALVTLVLLGLLVAAFPPAAWLVFKTPLAVVGAALYGALLAAPILAGWIVSGSQLADVEGDIRQFADEMDLRSISTDDRERRAQKLFQAHSGELKRYYDQALRQARHVYYVGLGSILLGVAVIAATFALVLSSDASKLSEKVIVGSLGAVGAVMANFIGVIYLRMFSDTISALTGFHGRLVGTHHLHFGNFVAAKIDDKVKRDDALSKMATALAWRQEATPEEGTSTPGGQREAEENG